MDDVKKVALRPAVDVFEDAYGAFVFHNKGSDFKAAAAIIEADRTQAAADERAAIVAFLKRGAEVVAAAMSASAQPWRTACWSGAYASAAESIERGEHTETGP